MKFTNQKIKTNRAIGEAFILCILSIFLRIGNTEMPKIAANIVTTPPALWGIDRKIAYAYKKYHSGLITAGVFILLIGCHCKGSAARPEKVKAMPTSAANNKANPAKSLIE